MCLGDSHAIHVADFMALFHDGEQHWRRWGCLVGDAVRDRGLPVLAVARLQHEALIAGTAVNAQREPIVPEPDVQGKFELGKTARAKRHRCSSIRRGPSAKSAWILARAVARSRRQ